MRRNYRHIRRRIEHRREVMEEEGAQFLWRYITHKRHHQLKEFLEKRLARQPKTLQQKSEDQIMLESVHSELTLPYDLLFKIFILLPAESLCKLQYVCKKWFYLMNSSTFIEFHIQQSETVLISQELFLNETPNQSWPVPPSTEKVKAHFHFVDFNVGNDNFVESSVINLTSIRASYDGLVVGMTEEKKSMILMNPLTRKHIKLPLGTIGFKDCYGLVFCSEGRTYKVVHLFREPSGYTGCEILSVGTRKWTVVDGPSSSLLEDIKLMPVSAGGSLYWMARGHGHDSFLSMNVQAKKFAPMKLPIICTLNDRLVEIGGVLGFVTHVTLNLMQVWILTRIGGAKENWIKRYSIYLNFDVRPVIPICSSRNGKEMVFEYPGNNLYLYNFETSRMKKIYSRDDELIHTREGAEKLFIPHRHTLVSWNITGDD